MCGGWTLGTAIRRGTTLPLLLAALASTAPSHAQQAATHGNQSPAITAGGNATVNYYGLTPEQMQELTKAAAAGVTDRLADRLIELSQKLGVTQEAALSLLRIIGEHDVPLEQLPQKLAEVAAQFKKFQTQLAALDPRNPLARGLVENAQAEAKAGNFAKAHELLREAKRVQIAAAQQARELRQKAQEAENKDFLQAAASSAAEGDLAMTELHYAEAANLFKEAASLVPGGHDDERWKYLNSEADALYRQGDEFGNNEALLAAIERLRHLAELSPRSAFPQAWAATQNNLGNALSSLGERESGTARLEEAVAAYREALKERTRARVPLQWAMTQMNLGVALSSLGERESGTARLEEAVAAYREALQEYTRARVPLDWARTQMNLGTALSSLGERESGTARLEEAVAAFREALQEYTRARAPLDWARTQYNVALVYLALYDKTSKPDYRDDALETLGGALEEFRNANAPHYTEMAERLRGEIIALKQENPAAKAKRGAKLPPASAERGAHEQ